MLENQIASEAGPNIRPSSLKKRKAMIEAARDVFLEYGFTSASVDEIADRANVSKRTVYRHFEDKQDLFRAVMQMLCRDVVPPSLEELRTDPTDPRRTLVAIGNHFLEEIYTAEQIELYRVVVSEAKRFPELGRMMNRRVIRSEAFVQSYLEDLQKTASVCLPCPDIAASQFLGLLKTNFQMRLLFGARKQLSRQEIRTTVECCVDVFLCGVGRKNQ